MNENNLFNTLNSFFDKIYLISLNESYNRQNIIKKKLKGLNYTFFRGGGVDGKHLDIKKLESDQIYSSTLSKKTVPYGRELTAGEIGCALSHLNVYRDMLQKGHEKVLILEDDLILNKNFNNDLSNALSQLPENWDLLYFGYRNNHNRIKPSTYFKILLAYPILNLLGYKKYDAKRLRRKYPRNYSSFLQRAGSHYGTHAYGVTRNGAIKILDSQQPLAMASDNAISEMCMNNDLNAFRLKTGYSCKTENYQLL